MMQLRQAAGIAALTAVAFASWYLTRQDVEAMSDEPPAPPLSQGYYLKQARIFGTSEDGALLYEIRADEAEQLADRSIEFANVNIRYSANTDVPWTVDADNAVINPAEPRIRLRGHVTARSPEGFAGNAVEIQSNYLELDPDRFVAETTERVQIRIGSRSLTATGMFASLQENELTLLANVRGTFAP